MAKLAHSVFSSRTIRALASYLEKRVPPLRAWHRFEYEWHFNHETPKARMFSGVYESFEAALNAIPKGSRIGHNHTEVADRHTSEIGHIRPSDYPVMFWMKSLLKEGARVFDLGGAVGILFYSFQRYVAYPRAMDWMVCEVPAVAKRGSELAQSRIAEGLSFTTRISDAESADILLASGSLQFLETPLWRSLSKMNLKPAHLLINRTALCEGPSFATLHNFGRAICAYQIWNRDEFLRRFEEIGYTLADFWETPEFSCYIPFHPERTIRAYSGVYFRLGGQDHA